MWKRGWEIIERGLKGEEVAGNDINWNKLGKNGNVNGER